MCLLRAFPAYGQKSGLSAVGISADSTSADLRQPGNSTGKVTPQGAFAEACAGN
jgi:hypothetical protein